MKTKGFACTLLTGLGFLLAALTILAVLAGLRSGSREISCPPAAAARSAALLDAVRAGDDAAACALLYGNPAPDTLPSSGSSPVRRLWDAYRDNLSYAFTGSCRVMGSGISREVTFTTLDLPAVLADLGDSAQTLLDSTQRDTQAPLSGEAADEILLQALEQTLSAAVPLRQQQVTLTMVYDGGQWWVCPDRALLEVLYGTFGS